MELPLRLKVKNYLQFFVIARNRNPTQNFDEYVSLACKRITQYTPAFVKREDFIFFFCLFWHHQMLPEHDDTKLYYPLWYKSYRDAIAKAMGVSLDSPTWKQFAEFFHGFRDLLERAKSIAQATVNDKAMLAQSSIYTQALHTEYYKIWCALRYHYTYWRNETTLRSLLGSTDLSPLSCDYDQPLFTKFASFIVEPAPSASRSTKPRATAAVPRPSRDPKPTSNAPEQYQNVPLDFVPGCTGLGHDAYHRAAFINSNSQAVFPGDKRKRSPDNQSDHGREKRPRVDIPIAEQPKVEEVNIVTDSPRLPSPAVLDSPEICPTGLSSPSSSSSSSSSSSPPSSPSSSSSSSASYTLGHIYKPSTLYVTHDMFSTLRSLPSQEFSKYERAKFSGFACQLEDFEILPASIWGLALFNMKLAPSRSAARCKKLRIKCLVVADETDPNLTQPLLDVCPDLGAISVAAFKCSTNRLGLGVYNMTHLQYLHLLPDGYPNNFYNAFKATSCTQALQSIFKRAPNLIGLFIPVPAESRRVDLSGTKPPSSLCMLGLFSRSQDASVDLRSVERLKIQHLALINLLIEEADWGSNSDDIEEGYEDYEPKGPNIYIGGVSTDATMRIFSDLVSKRPFGFAAPALIPQTLLPVGMFSPLFSGCMTQSFTTKSRRSVVEVFRALRPHFIGFYPAIPPPPENRTREINYNLSIAGDKVFMILPPETVESARSKLAAFEFSC